MSVPKVMIIGSGISGLACAHRLLELKKEKKLDFDLTLLEAGDRLGGTITTEYRDGFILEKGADSFLSEKPWATQLAKRIGIESELIGTQNEFRKSFIAKENDLIPLPEGFYLVAPLQLKSFLASPLLSLPGKLRMCLEPFVPKKQMREDESIGSFIERRFGKEALRQIGQPIDRKSVV